MARRIILDRRIADDPWALVGEGEALPPAGDAMVSLQLWLTARDTISARAGRTGVWLKPDDDPGMLAGDIAGLPLIAVQFPQFTDGRGYSTARLLRERYAYKGELRAIGEVLRDQLFYLARVGFNAFAVKEGKNIQDALQGLGDFSECYQSSVERPLPYYRRRLAGAAG